MIDEKIYSRIVKLKALADRGEEYEKESAQKKLQEILHKYKISSFEELELNNDEIKIYKFYHENEYELKLLRQCAVKVFNGRKGVKCGKLSEHEFLIQCTKLEKIEIDLDYEFYKEILHDELKIFMDAFIQAQYIFPINGEKKNLDMNSESELQMIEISNLIKNRTRYESLKGEKERKN